jgi:hypothetical protein
MDLVVDECVKDIVRAFPLFHLLILGCGIASWAIHTTRMFESL